MELSLWPNLILIEVLGGEPPMAQTHRRLPRRCWRRTAGGGGETRSRAIHPNFQVNNKQNPFMLPRKVNVKVFLQPIFWGTPFRHVSGGSPGGRGKLDKMLPDDYNPGFTFVVVQKRINTRIYHQTGRTAYDNPPCGTILDHTVTRFKYKDFFLVPQVVSQVLVMTEYYCPRPEMSNE